MKMNKKALFVVHFSFLHLCVDYFSVMPVMMVAIQNSLRDEWATFVPWLVIGYNAIAFLSQPFLGMLIDKLNITKDREWFKILFVVSLGLLVLGCGFSLIALCPPCWILMMILNGLGNSLFHVLGAKFVLRLSDKSSFGGFYVAAGAIGLGGGVGAGIEGSVIPYYVYVGLLAICLIYALLFYKDRIAFPKEEGYQSIEGVPMKKMGTAIAIVCLALAVRSFLGFYGGEVLPSDDLFVLLLLGFSIYLGKALGGLLLDYLGPYWTIGISSLGAMVLSCFLSNPLCYLFFPFFFNLLMPLTLDILRKSFPGREGLSFGLSAAFLIPGYLIALGLKGAGGQNIVAPIIVGVTGLLLLAVYFLLAKKASCKK